MASTLPPAFKIKNQIIAMHSNPCIYNYLPQKMLALSTVIVFLLFTWQGNKGFNLWDEGYLWYGAQRVMQGEVPIRDFMAYDPGRYYWSAALMSFFGDNGILSLRVAASVFQIFGLSMGLILIARTARSYGKENFPFLLISATTLVAWMFPNYRLFDISLSILLIGILTFLVENPSDKRYFLTGVFIGLIAFFGRNHGFYGVVGSLGVMVWLNLNRPQSTNFFTKFSFWSLGIVVGFTPLLILAITAPGFAVSFWESIYFLFEQKKTNLTLPVPWPWKVELSSTSFGDAVVGVTVGLFFIGTVVFAVFSVWGAIHQKLKNKSGQPVLVAASSLALPYAHYAFSRADVEHLALGVFPLLVGILAHLSTMSGKLKWALAIFLAESSLLMYIFHPGWQCYTSQQCIKVEISKDNLEVDPRTANDITLLRQLADKYAPYGQNFIAAPFWPGAYPLLERKSPIWSIYALWHRSEAFQQKEIERIKAANPGFAFVLDLPLDGRDELRFRNTHPLIYQFILDNFEPLPDSPNPAYKIYKRREL
jgi:hypothetical protein